MVQRLTEQYDVGDVIELDLGRHLRVDAVWVPGIVVGHDAPAIWVELVTGQRFFVTNTRKIRPKTTHPTPKK